MRLVPFSYNLRSLLVRRSATLLTVFGIGATVAVVAGVLALQQGFQRLFTDHGRPDVVVLLRKGATDEGSSAFDRERAEVLVKSTPEIALDAAGQPLASKESYLGVRRFKEDGGETNVPVRGVEPQAFAIAGDDLQMIEGRRFAPGADEVIVGQSLTGRIRDCRLGDTIVFNTTPFRVVGVFAFAGPYESEIWGDLDRISDALERPVHNRILARLAAGATVPAMAERLANHPHTPVTVLSEREYFTNQTRMLSGVLLGLGTFLALVMGLAAVFTATNTMLSALAARTHEIGILLSLGFRPVAVFVSFLAEAVLLCLLGGVIGALLTLPLNGVETGTTNYSTFTEVAFAFRVTPAVLAVAITFALVLGVLGGAIPAWRAARMSPTRALRRH